MTQDHSPALLILNAGSSSLKFAVFDRAGDSPTPVISGKIEGIGRQPGFSARTADGAALDPAELAEIDVSADHEAVIARLLVWLDARPDPHRLVAVGHRVVHGGRHFAEPVRITDPILDALDTLVPLAPLHQPHNLAAIRAVAEWRPDLPQFACFDTSFHRSQPPLEQRFALPRALSDEGILRYGFHGLSYDYIASILPRHLPRPDRVVIAHLGNGASMCATRNGQSMATTMGFTALDGLMMGRRCGALDPGILLYLMREKGMDADALETLLYRQSGLLGVSGISNNMHVLSTSTDPHAEEAIALYCHIAARSLAGLLPAIGGLDAIVFTAGIGENSALVRASICQQLAWLGVEIDPAANAANATRIDSDRSEIAVLVLPTNEESVVAAACRRLLADTGL